MCGIIAAIGVDPSMVAMGVVSLKHRGPDANNMMVFPALNITLGHTRLSILDLDERSNQPFVYGPITLVYNGELWNYKELRDELIKLGSTFKTSGDTEVVAAALSHWGIEALPRFNGMFAIAWIDEKQGDTLYAARDRFGEVPLSYAAQWPFALASERKALIAMGLPPSSFRDLAPGGTLRIDQGGYTIGTFHRFDLTPVTDQMRTASWVVRDALERGVEERLISDVPVCTLLSGGIDSSAIAAMLSKHMPNIVAYTAVLDTHAKDLRCARELAEKLGIELIEVKVPVPTADELREVIRVIEMPYKAHIEIGVACIQLAKRMQSDGFKVVFSGEGSDELWASYGFSYYGLQKQDWHAYRRDLFLSQSRKNFPRCNKIFLSHGVECRLPFLNIDLVEYAMKLPRTSVQLDRQPKAVLQQAFKDLPNSIVNRQKEAFQDGMKLKHAIAELFPDAQEFYRSEYSRMYEGKERVGPKGIRAKIKRDRKR